MKSTVSFSFCLLFWWRRVKFVLFPAVLPSHADTVCIALHVAFRIWRSVVDEAHRECLHTGSTAKDHGWLNQLTRLLHVRSNKCTTFEVFRRERRGAFFSTIPTEGHRGTEGSMSPEGVLPSIMYNATYVCVAVYSGFDRYSRA